MADSSETRSGGGCLRRLLSLILLAGAVGLGMAMVFITRSQDLTDIGGYDQTQTAAAGPDMKVVLQNSVIRGYPVTLTETQINRWLGRTLVAKQSGLLAQLVSLDRVWVRLEDGYAEVIIERHIMKQPFTVSMFFKVQKKQGPKGLRTEVHLHGGPYHPYLPQPLKGGRFGQLVVPQGFLLLVLPSYKQLATLFDEEIHLGFEEMARIKIEKHRLILNPLEPSNDPTGLPPAF
ncbi:MAG: hypothetical protein NTV46_06995 [Verrucomicrobia bacterium]|nr:hypothetical protein [Verrucomicrobiota bacterium]